MPRLAPVICILALLSLANSSALSQTTMGSIPSWTLIGAMNANNLVIGRLNHSLLIKHATGLVEEEEGSLAGGLKQPTAAERPIAGFSTVVGASEQVRRASLLKLGAHYPSSQRSAAMQLFDDLSRRYSGIESQFGLTGGDTAGAVAAMLAGSFMAYRNADFPDRQFKPLVRQMQVVLSGNEGFARIPEADRQDIYYQFSTLGMFLAATQMALKQTPDPALEANMRAAGEANLRRLLGVDPARLRLGPQGMYLEANRSPG
jgi:hypothetical protein